MHNAQPTHHRLLGRLTVLVAGLAALGFTSSAHAQFAPTANLTFSGGQGAPLTLTLDNTVTYTVTTASTSGPIFAFRGVSSSEAYSNLSGNITFSINGAAPITLTVEDGNINDDSIEPTDFCVWSDSDGHDSLPAGTTVTLLAGTITSTNNDSSAPPASGTYASFITDGNFNALSPTVAPEPST